MDVEGENEACETISSLPVLLKRFVRRNYFYGKITVQRKLFSTIKFVSRTKTAAHAIEHITLIELLPFKHEAVCMLTQTLQQTSHFLNNEAIF